jgi:hypothetical protein
MGRAEIGRGLAGLACVLAWAAGCQVVPRRDYAKSIQAVKEEAQRAAIALASQDHRQATAHVEKVLASAERLTGQLHIGDPRRSELDKAVQDARRIRDEVQRAVGAASSGDAAEFVRLAEADAARALADAEVATVEVQGPPRDGALPDVSAPLVIPGVTDAPPEVNLDEVPADERARGERPGALKVGEDTPPLVIQKVVTRSKACLVYFAVVNKTDSIFRVQGVEGEFKGGADMSVGSITHLVYKAEGFKPNYDDVFGCAGESLTMDGIPVPSRTQVQFVGVAERKRASVEAETVSLIVLTSKGERLKASGAGSGK